MGLDSFGLLGLGSCRLGFIFFLGRGGDGLVFCLGYGSFLRLGFLLGLF